MNTEFPRITTRGHFDLRTGKDLGKSNNYYLYPSKKFNSIIKSKEIVIFIHGMRNTRWGAQNGGKVLRRTLRKIGYKKHPVVSFSYDADVREAHKPERYNKVLRVANSIAKKNGKLLGKFIDDLYEKNPEIKVHLVGHSLGCNVVEHTKTNVSTIHLLGSPVEINSVKEIARYADTVINYYNPKDDVIREGVDKGDLKKPSCLNKVDIKNVKSKRCNAVHHGFRAYADKLRRFP